MLRIGLAGTGFMGTTHLERYRSMEGATVAAVAAPNTAADFVAEHGLDAGAYGSVDALLDAGGVDALDVCSPTHTHRRAVEAGLRRGLDVLCEKPLAPTLEDATAIADAAERSDGTLTVGHVLRFFPDSRRLREAVADGRIGEPGTARARRRSPFPDWGEWFADGTKSGGVFLDLAIHEFDYLRWLLGPVDRVFARRRRWEDRQHGHATLRFESGAVGYVEAGWDRVPDAELHSEIELAGDEGVVEYDAADPAPIEITSESTDVGPVRTVEPDGYRRELEAFVDAARTGDPPPVDVDDAVAAVRLSVAANRSADRGEPVRPPEVGR